jgi:hypothetical protein
MALSFGVEVEVSGERRRVQLVSRDISPGGIFLRTDSPAPVFKQVKLFMPQPDGQQLVLSGEVVRSLSPEQARAKGQPAGMAVAFDETSRAKSKQLLALVQILARRGDRTSVADQAPAPGPVPKPEGSLAPRSQVVEKADSLLSELDALLKGADESAPAPLGDDPDLEDFEPEVTDASGRRPALLLAADPPAPPARPTPPPAKRPASSPMVRPGEVSAQRPGSSPVLPMPPAEAAAHVVELQGALQEYRQALKGNTHYDILGLPHQASAEQVKQAFARLVGRLKPRMPSSQLPPELARGLAQALDKIKKAADTLSHAERRKAYDFLLQGDSGG